MDTYNTKDESPEFVLSEPAVVYGARKGLGPQIFFDLLFLTGLTKEELAAFFNISSKSISRYIKSEAILDPVMGEHALNLKGLYRKGIEVFENLENLRIWLPKNNYGLGGMSPLELMKTPGGLRLVKEELFRIEYGATA